MESLLHGRINPLALYLFFYYTVTYNETNHADQAHRLTLAHNAGDPPKLAKLGAVTGRLGGLDAGRAP